MGERSKISFLKGGQCEKIGQANEIIIALCFIFQICAPRWVENQYHVQDMAFMNGLCYESNKELEFDDSSGWPAFDNLKKQIHSSGSYYVYGMGMLGSSAAYSQVSSV